MTTWKKYQDKLDTGQSPLASFLNHPNFQAVAKHLNFTKWKQPGVDKYYHLNQLDTIRWYDPRASSKDKGGILSWPMISIYLS